jgi:hypothetical protein
MFSKFGRSWQLLKYTVELLKQDKKLVVFPALASIAAILVIISFVPLLPGTEELGGGTETPMGQADYVWLFLLYVALYFTAFFFNSALVACVLEKLNGGEVSISSGLSHAFARIVPIFGYAVIAATVGVILRAISERVGFIGQIVIGLMGAAWSIGTFLAVPVLVSRDVGPIDAVKESMRLLKQTWGENITANAGLGLAFFAVYLVGIAAMFAVFSSGLVSGGESLLWAIGIFVVLIALVALLHTTLQGIFSAVLYHFTNSHEDSGAMTMAMPQPMTDLLGSAFKPK